MPNYAMVDTDGNVTNICEWDGSPGWDAPEGITLVECDDQENAERGGTYIDGVFSRSVAPVEVADSYDVADQIAAMQAQLAELLAKVQ